jgi:hypothetical protein
VLYVDDLFLTGVEKLIIGCKANMVAEFEMDIKLMHYYLGLKVWHRPKEIFIGHGKYVV